MIAVFKEGPFDGLREEWTLELGEDPPLWRYIPLADSEWMHAYVLFGDQDGVLTYVHGGYYVEDGFAGHSAEAFRPTGG